MIRDGLIIFFMVLGTFFTLIGSIGLVRLPDFYTRVHAVSKGSTLGILGLLTAAMISIGSADIIAKGILAIFFHFLTTPAGAHMITRAAYHRVKADFWENTFAKEWNRE